MRRGFVVSLGVLGVLAFAGMFVDRALAGALYVVIGVLLASNIAVTAWRRKVSLPWWLIAAGFIATVVADLVGVASIVMHEPNADLPVLPFSSPLYIASYLAVIAGGIVIEVRRYPTQWRSGLLDSMALICVIAGAVWVFISGPILQSDLVLTDRVILVSYPVLDVVMFGVVAWMFFSSADRSRTLLMLCGSLSLWIVADLSIAVLEVMDAPFLALAPTRLGYLASYFLFAVTLHRRDIADVDVPQRETTTVSPARAVLLVFTLAILPVILIVGDRHIESGFLWALAAVVVVVGFTTAYRFGQLVRELHRAHAELLMTESALTDTQNALYRRATIDEVTGLPNRVTILERLDAELREGGDQLVGVCYLDLDGFKAVNDTYGHETGDRLLEHVAQRFAGRTRGSEAVGRLGGDEFLVVAVLTDAASGRALGERLARSIEAPFVVGEITVTVGVSVGVAIAPTRTPASDLLVRADRVMYQAKADPTRSVVVWSDGSGARVS